MSFLFVLCDVLLSTLLLFDTLGLIYQFRTSESSVDHKEYVRICFSWLLYFAICTLFSCSWKGFFGTLIRLTILFAKIYVVIPVLGGTNKIHKILIDDGKAEEFYKKVSDLIKSKCCKSSSCSNVVEEDSNLPSETREPESPEGGDSIPQ